MLILDEPTDGLDPNQKYEVRNLIREMSRDKAIILSTHILEEVDAVCTRAIIIAGGQVVADGGPAELESRSPRHNAVRLIIRASSDAGVATVLESVPGVERVRLDADDGLLRIEVVPEPGRTILEQVSTAVRERGWAVEEMYAERGRLDEVFRRVTEVQQS